MLGSKLTPMFTSREKKSVFLSQNSEKKYKFDVTGHIWFMYFVQFQKSSQIVILAIISLSNKACAKQCIGKKRMLRRDLG